MCSVFMAKEDDLEALPERVVWQRNGCRFVPARAKSTTLFYGWIDLENSEVPFVDVGINLL